MNNLFSHQYSRKDSAVEEIRSMYLNGSSPLDIIQYIRGSDLITPNTNDNASLFLVECFCLPLGMMKRAEAFLSAEPRSIDAEYIYDSNSRLKEEIESKKSKWHNV